MIDGTIFLTFTAWVADNWFASAIAGGITWDATKQYLLSPFKTRFSKFFKDEEQAETYLESLCNNKVVNLNKPYRDVEDKYEEIVKTELPQEFIEELKQFIIDNKELIETMNTQANTAFNIKEQHASRDISNVNGTQIIINK